MKGLWLRPSVGDNISLRRTRIAEELAERGIHIDIQDAGGLDAVTAVRRAITGDYDVILGNVRVGLYLGFPLAKLLRKPFIGTVSDPIDQIEDLPGPLFRFFEWYEWQALARADGCSFVYQSSFEEAERRGIEGRKLPNAVNYEMFADPDSEAVDRSRSILESDGVDLDKPVGIYLGGLIEDRYSLEAIVDAAGQCPDWEIVFVGDGPDRDIVETGVETYDNVYYPGAFEYDLMPGFLSHAEVGFCIMDAEQPLKIGEYGAAGLAVITREGELSDRFGEDALYVAPPTGDGVATALQEIGGDTERRQRYAETLRESIKSVQWSDVADEYAEMIRAAVDGSADTASGTSRD